MKNVWSLGAHFLYNQVPGIKFNLSAALRLALLNLKTVFIQKRKKLRDPAPVPSVFDPPTPA